jgi:hypothetical protein
VMKKNPHPDGMGLDWGARVRSQESEFHNVLLFIFE